MYIVPTIQLINFALVALLIYLQFKTKSLYIMSFLSLINVISLVLLVTSITSANAFSLVDIKYYDQQCLLHLNDTISCVNLGPTTIETITIDGILSLVIVWLMVGLVFMVTLYKFQTIIFRKTSSL